MKDLWKKIQRKLLHLRLQPIRVFCFHQVGDQYDPTRAFFCDWTQIEQFKKNILILKSLYTFISLSEAYEKIRKDKFRIRKFAVLTSDDGYSSVLQVIPWLVEQQIPITLFLNSSYLDGRHYIRELFQQAKKNNPDLSQEDVAHDLYITKEQLVELNHDYVTIGMHGLEHISANNMNADEFKAQYDICNHELKNIPGYIPFYAYTFGNHSICNDLILWDNSIHPVLIDGEKNYNDTNYIHRECIDKWQL